MPAPAHDIFRMDKDGSLFWIGVAESIEGAKHQIRILSALAPADYLILSQTTGERIIIRTPETPN
jgi:hypothetical protein